MIFLIEPTERRLAWRRRRGPVPLATGVTVRRLLLSTPAVARRRLDATGNRQLIDLHQPAQALDVVLLFDRVNSGDQGREFSNGLALAAALFGIPDGGAATSK